VVERVRNTADGWAIQTKDNEYIGKMNTWNMLLWLHKHQAEPRTGKEKTKNETKYQILPKDILIQCAREWPWVAIQHAARFLPKDVLKELKKEVRLCN